MKILLLDIETAPHTAFVWGLWKENIPLARLKSHGRTLCWAAKWFGSDLMLFRDERDKDMVTRIHALLTEADVIVTYNGLGFDIPMLNNEFVKKGLDPIPPQKHIDMLRLVRSKFRLASNKLEHVVEYLKLGEKVHHKGFDLWIGCMEGKIDDWKQMKEYNIGDVLILEKLYLALRPWIKNHPDVDMDAQVPHCAACGSSKVQRRGIRRTKHFAVIRLHCQDCGAWSDGSKLKIKQKKVA